MSTLASHQDGMDARSDVFGAIVNTNFEEDYADSVTPPGPGEISTSLVVTHRDNLQNIWGLLHQRYIVSSMFNKGTLSSTLARKNYTS